MGALADGFTRLTGGDFKGRLETPFAADFEQLRTDFNKTVSNLDAKIEAEREAAHQTELTISCIASGLKELSGGNLEIRLKDALPGEYEKLRTDFNAALARLQDTMQKVTGTIGGIETAPAKSAAPATTWPAAPNSRPPAWNKPPRRWRKSPPR